MDNRKISMLDINKTYNGESILKVFNEYIEYCYSIENSIELPELLKSGEKAGEQRELKVKRPMTVQGFCVFAGISFKTFYNYLDENVQKDNEMLQICIRIHEYITGSLVDNSLVGRINPMLASRLAGINETLNVNSTGDQPAINISIGAKAMDLTK